MTRDVVALQLRLFLVAVRLHTRLPVVGRVADWVGRHPEFVARSTRYFPLVGALVGVLVAFAYALAGGFLPHGVAVMVALGAGVLITGAIHESGFVDFCDRFGAHARPERAPRTVRDSRIGAYGALGVAMLLLARFETLGSLDPEWIASAFVAGHAWSRGCVVAVMAGMPRCGESHDGAERHAGPTGAQPTALDAGIALALAALPTVGIALWTGTPGRFVVGGVAAALVTLWPRRAMRRRLGGYSDDGLGAVQQAAELAFHVGLLGGLVLAAEAPGDVGP